MTMTRRELLALAAGGGLSAPWALSSRTAWAQAADPWKQGFDAARASNPVLLGWQGAERDLLASDTLPVEGRWPQELAGTFYRNGPAGHETGGQRYHHWFDGDGMVQAFDISSGEIRHRGRFVETAKRRAELDAGHMLWPAFGAPFTAHPKVEPDGTLWAFGYALSQGLLALYRIDAAGKVVKAGTIGVSPLGMVHDFAVTAHSLVFVLPPLVFEPERVAPGASFLDAHVWRSALGTRVLAVDKDDFGRRRWWQLPPGFTFHFGNAWEDGDAIRFDYCVAPDATELTDTFREVMRGVWLPPTGPMRFAQVALGKGDAVEQRILDDRAAEFPRVAPGDQHDFHSASLKDLERRDPIHAGRFHRHRRNPRPLEPFGQAMEVVGERRERTHRFGIQVFGHRHHMESRTDIDPGGPWMNHGPLSLSAFRSCHHSLPCLVMSRRAGRRKASIS